MLPSKDIYNTVIAHCKPFQLSGPWRFLEPPPDFYTAPADRQGLLNELCGRFAIEQLRNAGVLRGAGEHSTLHPALDRENAVIAALRQKPDEPPFDFVVDEGCPSRRLPATAALRDHRTIERRKATPSPMLLAFSMVDVAILAGLGLPATVASGLDRLAGRHLDNFCRAFSLRKGAPIRIGGEVAPTLVGWSIAKLDLAWPFGLDAAVAHLDALERHLDLSLGDVSVWRPHPEELETIEFCRNFAPSRLKDLIKESMQCSANYFATALDDTSPPDYATALKVWRNAVAGNDDRDRQQEAQKQLRDAQDRELIEPLFDAAKKETDPVRRTLLTTFAELNCLVHPQLATVAVRMLQKGNTENQSWTDSIPAAEFQQSLAVVDRLMKIAGELNRTTPAKRRLPSLPSQAKSRRSASSHWG